MWKNKSDKIILDNGEIAEAENMVSTWDYAKGDHIRQLMKKINSVIGVNTSVTGRIFLNELLLFPQFSEQLFQYFFACNPDQNYHEHINKRMSQSFSSDAVTNKLIFIYIGNIFIDIPFRIVGMCHIPFCFTYISLMLDAYIFWIVGTIFSYTYFKIFFLDNISK